MDPGNITDKVYNTKKEEKKRDENKNKNVFIISYLRHSSYIERYIKQYTDTHNIKE